MIQQLLAKLQTYKQESQNPTEEEETEEEQETEVEEANVNVSTANPTHLDTPFKLPMEYLSKELLHSIDKSVLSDLELIECTKQINKSTIRI